MTASDLGVIEVPPGERRELSAPTDHHVTLAGAAATAFMAMQRAARRDGVGLVPVSGFRSITRQTEIWNRKFDAARAAGLSDADAVVDIMRWSAPPGWSRHHFGSDLDLVGEGLAGAPRLEAGDWEPGAVCGVTSDWLAANADDYGWRRPYDVDRGGFQPEPWHWSFAPIARARIAVVQSIDWSAWLAGRPFNGASVLLEQVEELFERFVLGVAPGLLTN